MTQKPLLVIFVEGQTDREFFNKMIPYIQSRQPDRGSKRWIVRNVKGIGNYQKKAARIFKHEIIAKYPNCNKDILCTYDSDLFELQQKPPVDWEKVAKDLTALGADTVSKLQAVHQIEDWFLLDLPGICGFLNITVPSSGIKGKDGNEKMKSLFKKGNKVYQKGTYVHKFLDKIDMQLLYSKLSTEMELVESTLFL